MISRAIAQAIVRDGVIVARSDDFDEAWRPEVERIVEGFGLPSGVSAAEIMFAVPFGGRQVGVVSVSGRRFRFLILSRPLYKVIPDPFAIADKFPPQWDAPATMPTIEWPEQLLPERTVEQLDSIFKNGDGPFLLGACQTLVDTGRIALQREEPQWALFRDVWALLPFSTQRQTWPATYAYSTTLPFSMVAMPEIPEGGIPGYLSEDQARDYPESRYERELQFAVEHNDQRTLTKLLNRRSSAETLRLALWMVFGAVAAAILMRFLMLI